MRTRTTTRSNLHSVVSLMLWASVTVAGCRGSTSEAALGAREQLCPNHLQPAQTERLRDSTLAALTDHSWSSSCDRSSPLPPTCTKLILRRDGSYTFTAVSDYTERSDEGHWNFAATGENAGVLCLDGANASARTSQGETNLASTMHFEVSAEELRLPRFVFEASGAGEGIARPFYPVRVAPEFTTLTAKKWANTNDFDAHSVPNAVSFANAAEVEASYRGGECVEKGIFGVDKGELSVLMQTSCDERLPNQIYTRVYDLYETGDSIAMLGSTFRDVDAPAGTKAFTFESYTDSLRVTLSFEGQLTTAATDVHVEFLALDPKLPKALRKLSVTALPLSRTSDGFMANGEPTLLVARDYDVTLALSETFADTISLALPTSGVVQLSVKAEYADDRQSYVATGSPIVTVP